MTKFVKADFTRGMYAMYQGKFVARFKHGGRTPFLAFLVKNFTVEEYFARLEAGEMPLNILESKGYVSPTVKKLLKAAGFPQTVEGMWSYVASQMREYRAGRT